MARSGPIVQSIEGIVEEDLFATPYHKKRLRRVEQVFPSKPTPQYADRFSHYRRDAQVYEGEQPGQYVNAYT